MIFLNSITIPFKFFIVKKYLKSKSPIILDVGCGNKSPSSTKEYFPSCKYHGLDSSVYNNSSSDLSLVDVFYDVNLDDFSKLEQLPSDYYDLIILSHVIEHLKYPLDVISILTTKLNHNGIIYIEYPSVNSLSLPSMKGTLNFSDDPSHIHLFNLADIGNVLLSHGLRILKGGKRRFLRRIFLSPFVFLKNLHAPAGAFWDLLGFAEYIIAKK